MDPKVIHALETPAEVGGNSFATLLHGEEDKVRRDVFSLICPEDTESRRLQAGITIVYPHCRTKGHSHPDREEVYYFLRGNGVMIADGRETRVAAGDVYYLPFGPVHTTRNEGDLPLEFFWMTVQKQS